MQESANEVWAYGLVMLPSAVESALEVSIRRAKAAYPHWCTPAANHKVPDVAIPGDRHMGVRSGTNRQRLGPAHSIYQKDCGAH